MTVSTLPQPVDADPVIVSDDAAYDWQAQAGPLTSRWKANAVGVLGMLSGGPYKLGMHLLGFTATNERAYRNIVSFAAVGASAMISYQMLTRPTALVDMLSGRPFATAAERGAEPVTFGNRAQGGGGRGGPLTVQLIADGRKLAEVVLPHVAAELDAAAGGGYSRRT